MKGVAGLSTSPHFHAHRTDVLMDHKKCKPPKRTTMDSRMEILVNMSRTDSRCWRLVQCACASWSTRTKMRSRFFTVSRSSKNSWLNSSTSFAVVGEAKASAGVALQHGCDTKPGDKKKGRGGRRSMR